MPRRMAQAVAEAADRMRDAHRSATLIHTSACGHAVADVKACVGATRSARRNAMKIDDDGRESSDRLFDVFGGFMSDDFLEVAVLCGTRDGAAEFVVETVEPAVVGADADGVDAQIADALVARVEDARNDEDALVCDVAFFLHDVGGDAVEALSDDVSVNGDVSAVHDFVVVAVEHEALPLVEDFGGHAAAEALRELFVEHEAAVIAVDGDEDVGGDEFDEEFKFALIAVTGAVEIEIGSVD